MSEQEKIEKNLPVPEVKTGRPPKYPFNTMQAGDSVFIEGATTKSKEYVAAMAYNRRSDKQFCARTVEENGVKGLRIWRTE